MGLRKHN